MGFPKGTILGEHKRDDQGRLLNKDGSLFNLVPNRGMLRKGQRSSPETEFKKGTEPHNKGKKLVEYAPEYAIKKMMKTTFQKGSIPALALPVGTIRRRLNKGVPEYIINIDWKGNRKPNNSYKWYLWEIDNEQDRPTGMVLAIKNGDVDDIRIENLELITRAENLARNNGRSL